MLRWRSDAAIKIYARMNDSERAEWIQKAKTQRVDSTITAHLPRLDHDDWVAHMRTSIRSGDLGRAQRKEEMHASALVASLSRSLSPSGGATP